EAGGPRLGDSVDELMAADLVLEAAPGERREGRYRFKHAIVQEVAYNTLLLRRRIELHRRVAVAYETVLGEGIRDFLPALAHHYLLGDVPDKAAEYSWKAAERATAIHAHVEALQLAEQSLELYEKLARFNDAIKPLLLIARASGPGRPMPTWKKRSRRRRKRSRSRRSSDFSARSPYVSTLWATPTASSVTSASRTHTTNAGCRSRSPFRTATS